MNREKLRSWAIDAERLAAETSDARLAEPRLGITGDVATIVEGSPRSSIPAVGRSGSAALP